MTAEGIAGDGVVPCSGSMRRLGIGQPVVAESRTLAISRGDRAARLSLSWVPGGHSPAGAAHQGPVRRVIAKGMGARCRGGSSRLRVPAQGGGADRGRSPSSSGLLLLLAAGPARAQTVIDVGTASELVSALTTVDNNPGTDYVINLTTSITLDATTTLPVINSASSVTINGGTHHLDGAGVQRGFFVYAGTVAINDLSIDNTVARGGHGGDGASGGGGAGLGSALFVRDGASLTVSDVSLIGNSARWWQPVAMAPPIQAAAAAAAVWAGMVALPPAASAAAAAWASSPWRQRRRQWPSRNCHSGAAGGTGSGPGSGTGGASGGGGGGRQRGRRWRRSRWRKQ